MQAPSNLTGSKIKSTHIFSLLNSSSEICMTSNIGKSNCHVGCLNSEGKTIKPTISNLSQNTHLRRLPANLNFGWQAPEGILEPGLYSVWCICLFQVCTIYLYYLVHLWGDASMEMQRQEGGPSHLFLPDSSLPSFKPAFKT